MTTVAVYVIVVSLGVIAYVYAGYPLLLRLLVTLRGERRVNRREITPRVSLVISASNEEAVIGAKIENSLGLDYPAGALEVVVVSDGSTDGTDALVATFAGRGVKLIRQAERRGKTAGLNLAMPQLSGEIVVFSDANAMYEPDALRRLVRNFADPAVGCVTGEARYTPGVGAASDVGERFYWNYEMQIKRLESAAGSMVGGDGAIYAIRRELWRDLPESAINDFLNPLQIVAAGRRAIYEPEAVCYEETAGRSRSEYRRRVRIVSRSWRAVFQAPQVLNPWRVGLFAWSVASHKILRWLSGVFAGAAALGLVALALDSVGSLSYGVIGAALAAVAVVLMVPLGRRALGLLGYFSLITAASLIGVVKGSLGHVSGTWSTPREVGDAAPTAVGLMLPVGWIFLGGAAVALLAGLVWLPISGGGSRSAVVFWGSVGVLAYVFVGYPALLAVVSLIAGRPVSRAPIEPSVCVFIAANDEGAVIEAKLRNALALDYPADRLEIVVASDGSVDDTNAIVRRFAPRVRLLEFSPRRGKIGAINEGMRSVESEIVVLTDANTFLEPGALRALVRAFADARVGAVSGDVALIGERAALGRSEDLYYRYERWLQRAESELGSMIGVDGALYAIRRRLFVPPASDTILDDMAIPMAVVRAGYRVVFEPDARAHEQGVATAREEFSRKSRVIAGAVQFLTRPDSVVPVSRAQVIFSLVSHKAVRWLTPVFVTGAFLSSLVLASSSEGYAAVALAQAGLVAFGLAGCAPSLRRLSIVAVAHYFCLVQAAAAVGFVRGVSGRQSVLWRRFGRVTAHESTG